MSAPDHPAAGDLGIGPGMQVWVGGHNLDAKRAVAPLLADTTRPAEGPLDVAIVCPAGPDEAVYFCRKVLPRMSSGSRLYVVVPLLSDGSADPRYLECVRDIESLSGWSSRDGVIPGFSVINASRL